MAFYNQQEGDRLNEITLEKLRDDQRDLDWPFYRRYERCFRELLREYDATIEKSYEKVNEGKRSKESVNYRKA